MCLYFIAITYGVDILISEIVTILAFLLLVFAYISFTGKIIYTSVLNMIWPSQKQ